MLLAERYRAFRAHALAGRVTRYAIGSMLAATSSAIAFAVVYVLGASTTTCSVSAFVAGAIPNWVLNRRWTWQRRGRPVFGREIIGYIAVSIVSLVTTSAATAWTNDHVKSIPPHHGIRAILVTGSYMAVVAVLFVAKFWIYEYWCFSEVSRVRAALRSLRQVPRTARANRIP